MGTNSLCAVQADHVSLRTVTRLSAEWREAVASNLSGPQHTFPAPWFPAATINGVEIIPIYNSADLYREGAFMHHYRHLAWVVLRGARAELDQLRGPM
jgi:hypothetical protein